jgi:hypothetical protein
VNDAEEKTGDSGEETVSSDSHAQQTNTEEGIDQESRIVPYYVRSDSRNAERRERLNQIAEELRRNQQAEPSPSLYAL